MHDPIKDRGNRQPMDEALCSRESKLCSTLLDKAPFAAFIFKDDNICYYANHSAETLTGYTRDELFNMKYWDFVHPDFQELVKTRGHLRQTGASVPSRYEVKIITKNGETRWVDLSATSIRLDGDRFVLVTGIDISERKNFEGSLKLAQFGVETSADAIFWITSEGRLFHVNKSACKELGYSHEELQSLHVWDIDPLYPEGKMV